MTILQEMEDPGSQELYQKFQWSPDGAIAAIQVESDPKSGKKVVFLEEIQNVFPGKIYIKNGIMVVSHLKDGDGQYFEPRRILSSPNVTLQVFLAVEPQLQLQKPAIVRHPSSSSSSSSDSRDSISKWRRHQGSPPSTRKLLNTIVDRVEEVKDNQQKNHAEMVGMTKITHTLILDKANAIFKLTYELHEYPIPRLFVILPSRTSFKDRLNPLVDKYRLYFLCECDVSSGDGTRTRPNIHFAKHDGYDLERPTEFFRKYGSYILTLLQLLRFSVIAASFAVPMIAGIGQGLGAGIDNAEEAVREQLADKVDEAIEFLRDLPSTDLVKTGNDLEDDDLRDDTCTIEALEGADLRHLALFLKNRDPTQILGNLYRLARPDGTIKWVCLDHYREEYKMIDKRHFEEFVTANSGTYQAYEGKVVIRLDSKERASQFYQQLRKAKFVNELVITLAWHTTLEDFKELRTVMDSLPTILSLTVDCCNAQSRFRDIVSRGTPSTILAKLMAGHGIQSFAIRNCGEFLSQMEKLTVMNQLRQIDLGTGIEGRAQVSLISSLVKKSPRLRYLIVQLPNLRAARSLFINASSYEFKGVSTLQARIETTGELLTGTIDSNKFTEISLVAMDCEQDFSIFPFVTKMTTAIVPKTDLAHLDRFISNNANLKEINIQVEVAKFYDTLNFLVRRSKGIHSAYFHDDDSSLLISDIRDPCTAVLDLKNDSTDFDRLFNYFGVVPRSLGGHTIMTNEVMAILEDRTRTGSRLQDLWLDISILDSKGVENAIQVIQRSKLQSLTVWCPKDVDVYAVDPTSEAALSWKLLEAVAPILKRTRLHFECQTNQIYPSYIVIRDLFSIDSDCRLSLGDGESEDNLIVLDDIHDSKTANVTLSSDDLGVDLEEFYEVFGALPSLVGVTTPISDPVAAFLDRVVVQSDGSPSGYFDKPVSLKRIIVNPSTLCGDAQEQLLGVLERCKDTLSELKLWYKRDSMEEFLSKAVSRLGKAVELVIDCRVEEFLDVHGLLQNAICEATYLSGLQRRLSLVDGPNTIRFEDIRDSTFKICNSHTSNEDRGRDDISSVAWELQDVLPAELGYLQRITSKNASRLNKWTENFSPHYRSIRVDTTSLRSPEAIQNMVSVISRTLQSLVSLTVYCSDGQDSEKTKRNQFLEEVLPFLNYVELYIHCHVSEFGELSVFLQGHATLQSGTFKPRYLCDGDRYLVLPAGDGNQTVSPPMVVDLQGRRGVYYRNTSGELEDNWDELGDTLLTIGSRVVSLDTEAIVFFDKDVALLSFAIGSTSQLRSLRISSAHLSQKGFEGMQEIVRRSPLLKEFAFVCGSDYAFTVSPPALVFLDRNRKVLTELVLKGAEIRFWLRELIHLLPIRGCFPKLSALKISSDGESLDVEVWAWVIYMVNQVKGIDSLKTVQLSNFMLSNKTWKMLLNDLASDALEELDLSGSNVTLSQVTAWIDRCALFSPLKRLHVQGTYVNPSSDLTEILSVLQCKNMTAVWIDIATYQIQQQHGLQQEILPSMGEPSTSSATPWYLRRQGGETGVVNDEDEDEEDEDEEGNVGAEDDKDKVNDDSSASLAMLSYNSSPAMTTTSSPYTSWYQGSVPSSSFPPAPFPAQSYQPLAQQLQQQSYRPPDIYTRSPQVFIPEVSLESPPIPSIPRSSLRMDISSSVHTSPPATASTLSKSFVPPPRDGLPPSLSKTSFHRDESQQGGLIRAGCPPSHLSPSTRLPPLREYPLPPPTLLLVPPPRQQQQQQQQQQSHQKKHQHQGNSTAGMVTSTPTRTKPMVGFASRSDSHQPPGAPQMLYPTAMCLQEDEMLASRLSSLGDAVTRKVEAEADDTVPLYRTFSPHDRYPPPPKNPKLWTQLPKILNEE
ncbi:hypothetical protein BGZ83_007194 [Gryganskiella cystojenkinii]|nr:hypothetical protein BGZ83_007194 [Gryganskiella cystojenkinii]